MSRKKKKKLEEEECRETTTKTRGTKNLPTDGGGQLKATDLSTAKSSQPERTAFKVVIDVADAVLATVAVQRHKRHSSTGHSGTNGLRFSKPMFLRKKETQTDDDLIKTSMLQLELSDTKSHAAID